MKTDANGIQFLEDNDRIAAYGARVWQGNFETISKVILHMQEKIKILEEEIEGLKNEMSKVGGAKQ